MADAIEQLTGVRPNHEQRRNHSFTSWTVRKYTLERVYRYGTRAQRAPEYAFPNAGYESKPGLLEMAQMLMPRAHAIEKDDARRHLERVNQQHKPPTADELELELKLIELLAAAEGPQFVLSSMFRRWSAYGGFDPKSWAPAQRAAAFAAYRDTAVRILQTAEDWKTVQVPYLHRLARNRSGFAGTVLMHVLSELDQQQQLESVVNFLQLVAAQGHREHAESIGKAAKWLDDDSNRNSLHEQLKKLEGDAWEDLAVGVFRSGLADDTVKQIVRTRFGDNSINRIGLFRKLIRSLDQPSLADVAIELFKHPALNEPTKVEVLNKTQLWTLRAAKFLPELGTVGLQNRQRFVPMLKELNQSKWNGESQSAQQLLEIWKNQQ